MKNTRAVLVLLLALVAGLGAMVLAARWITGQVSYSGPKVAVAARDINLGTPIDASMVQMVDWPQGARPEGAEDDPKKLDGRVLKTSVLRGEPLLENKLAPVGTKGGLSAVISEGKRAITVRVNEVVGVAGFALPGNFVDVMVNAQDEQQKPISKIVLDRILVLAVAQEASRDDTKPRVVNAVTLEVTPEQAELLDLARSVDTLSLVLRNQIDSDSAATAGVRRNDLLFGRTPEAPPPAPKTVARAPTRRVAKAVPTPPPSVEKERPSVEVIRGVSRSNVEF